ncbi:retrovirus-related pol polyprotein from transposon TNT 1-94 [Tanacetum coccineum]
MSKAINGIMREEVYVSQPDGFVDQDNPNHVYKLKKALYGLKQAPRAWYDLLSKFLLSQEFSKGTVDPTLFIRRQGKDILLVQIYVDDIIFSSTTPELCDQFSKIMCSKFKMSMMGKISLFLGLQISQCPRGIFLNQSKYALKSLKKYGMESSDPLDTPMVEKSKLDEDIQGKVIDPIHYRGMIGTLMYLIASRLDLTFAVRMCARRDSAGYKILDDSTSDVSNYWEKTCFVWSSKRQKSIAISSIEAKYIAMSGCCAQILWMRSQLTDYGLRFNKIPMYCDNKTRFAMLTQCSTFRSMHLTSDSSHQKARERIEFLINKLGMRSFTPETLNHWQIKLKNSGGTILTLLNSLKEPWIPHCSSEDKAKIISPGSLKKDGNGILWPMDTPYGGDIQMDEDTPPNKESLRRSTPYRGMF